MIRNTQFLPHNRRGLSSIVGALFFTVLMIAGFSVLSLALDAQTDIVATQRVVSDIEIKKQQEKFSVFATTDANDVLNLSVNNQGQNPVEISSIWITNKTLPDQPIQRYSINYDDAFVPPNFVSNVVSTQTLEIIPNAYDIKVISALGTIKTIELDNNGGGSSDLRVELFTDPPDPVIGKNVTVALMVTNTGLADTITNVQPFNFDVSAPLSVGLIPDPTSNPPPIPASANLNPGASVMFTWDFQVTGNSGDVLTFSSAAIGDSVGSSNTASDTSKLRIAGEGGSEEEIVLKDELFGKPQIFMITPNPLGDDNDENDRPVWGVNVANPTDQPMFVSKIVIMAMSPRATASDAIFVAECEKPANAQSQPVTISPTPDRWSCPESNQLMWRDVFNPQEIAPRSVFPFLVKIGAGNIGGTLPDAENILVQPIVFTTLGQFGKSGFGSTMHSGEVALPNVFLARTPNSVSSSNIMGELRGIPEGSIVTFNATLADMSDDIDYGINAGTDLIINVPQEWTFGSVISHVGFNVPTITTYPDGSTQIIADLQNSIDEHSEAKTIQFTATAPTVGTKAKMYVMHILANGIATGSGGAGTFTIGPVSESVLQVCPTSGCP